MPLATGSTLSSYVIVSPLGAGAMGEVYRARDTRLGREVAIKVLPEHFADDEERLRRFEREAKTLASLNHPNVAQIYGVDTVGDNSFLVLELVPGESLSERLERGALPLAEALEVCRQIAEGLEAAHEAGVVHRDLKPANVHLTPDGRVKVLDFGLAKTANESGSGATTDSVLSTEAGRLLGTPTYMAPEQARGKPIDKRVDLWAFGCVLFECLTGKRAFSGGTTSDVLAAVLERDPNWKCLPAATPRHVRALLARCLEKDPRRRLRDAGDARLLLEPDADAGPVRRASRTALVAAALACGALGFGLRALVEVADPVPAPVQRFALSGIAFVGDSEAVISPDGRRLVHQGRSARSPWIVQPFDDFEPQPIPGTEGGRMPFFSPDGEWLGFLQRDQLMRVPVTGGAAQRIARLTGGAVAFGAWLSGDSIVIGAGRSFGAPMDGLVQVSASGREPPRVLTHPDPERGERVHALPEALPGDRTVLFTSVLREGHRIEAVDLATLERRVLIEGAAHPRWVETGHLLFWRPPRADVLAVRFDPERLEVRGPEVAVLESVAIGALANAKYSLSRTGTLVYGSATGGDGYTLVRVDRQGRVAPLHERRDRWAEPRFSPDGSRILLRQLGNPDCSAWCLDTTRGALMRLTSDGDVHGATWLDGERIAYRLEGAGLFAGRADGSGEGERLLEDARPFYPYRPTPDGARMALTLADESGSDVWVLELGDGGELRPLLTSPHRETMPAFSPDGRWLAYCSNESGRDEVYVRPYPGPGTKVPVSVHGGTSPLWSRDGSELFFTDDTRLMAASITTEPALAASAPQELFRGSFATARPQNFDVAPDGRSFVMLLATEDAAEEPEVRVVLNWFEELEQRLATAGGDGR